MATCRLATPGITILFHQLPLVEPGVITNEHKYRHSGCLATGCIVGNRYDFVDDNPLMLKQHSDYVDATALIRSTSKVTALNSATEIGLTGQVVFV
ncbi:acetyl-CoA hydrolase/transferase C-terminal domain-containing protein [Pontibacter sp. CAU 1760]